MFGSVCTADVEGSTNRELFAAAQGDLPALLRENAAALSDGELSSLMETVGARLDDYAAGGCVLTDDKAPVELLGMRLIDSIISDELGYYKQIFREQGVRGLIGAF